MDEMESSGNYRGYKLYTQTERLFQQLFEKLRVAALWNRDSAAPRHFRIPDSTFPASRISSPRSGRGHPSYTAFYCCRYFQNQSSHRRTLAPRAPVVHHRCRGGCSSGKINTFILPDAYPHRPSPMSILIRVLTVLAFLCVPAPPRDAQIPALRARSRLKNRSHSSCRCSSLCVGAAPCGSPS